jgi:hypothetical protein
VEVAATVIELSLTLSNDIDSFEASTASLTASLKSELGCNEPTCFLELRATTAGSVNVVVLISIPDRSAAHISSSSSASISASVEAAATSLMAKPLADLTALLGVSVASTAPVQVATGVKASLVVAPPPPFPPPPSSPPLFVPPLASHASSPPPNQIDSNHTKQGTSNYTNGQVTESDGVGSGGIIGAVVVLLLIALATTLYWLVKRRRASATHEHKIFPMAKVSEPKHVSAQTTAMAGYEYEDMETPTKPKDNASDPSFGPASNTSSIASKNLVAGSAGHADVVETLVTTATAATGSPASSPTATVACGGEEAVTVLDMMNDAKVDTMVHAN